MSKPNLDLENLTLEERLAILEEVWESISERDVSLSPEVSAELDRRLDDVDAGETNGRPWREVIAGHLAE